MRILFFHRYEERAGSFSVSLFLFALFYFHLICFRFWPAHPYTFIALLLAFSFTQNTRVHQLALLTASNPPSPSQFLPLLSTQFVSPSHYPLFPCCSWPTHSSAAPGWPPTYVFFGLAALVVVWAVPFQLKYCCVCPDLFFLVFLHLLLSPLSFFFTNLFFIFCVLTFQYILHFSYQFTLPLPPVLITLPSTTFFFFFCSYLSPCNLSPPLQGLCLPE